MGVLAHVVPKTPPRKMCQKPHPEKNRFDWKSQGQIFQECVECQGQISQGQMGNPNNGQSEKSKNSKVKYFRKRMGKKLPPKSGKIKIRKMWKTGIRKKFFFNQKYNQ